jgi:hypothetical protein
MAKKSRPGNSRPARIVELWETLTAALRKLARSALALAAKASKRKIKKDSKFRGFFDSSLSGSGGVPQHAGADISRLRARSARKIKERRSRFRQRRSKLFDAAQQPRPEAWAAFL